MQLPLNNADKSAPASSKERIFKCLYASSEISPLIYFLNIFAFKAVLCMVFRRFARTIDGALFVFVAEFCNRQGFLRSRWERPWESRL